MKLFDVISYNKGRGAEDGNNYWLRFRTAHFAYVSVMLLIFGILMGLVSLFVCGVYVEHLGWEYFLSYFSNPLIIVLNIVPCVLLVFLVWFISGRAWIGVFVPSLIIYTLSLINYYKIRILNDTFTAGNFKLAGEALGILDRYRLEITGRTLLPVAALILTTLFAAFFMRGKLRSKAVRIIGIVLIIAICAGLFVFVYSSDSVFNKVTNTSDLVKIDKYIQLDKFVSRGFLFPFLHSVKDAFPHAPDGYSAKAVQTLLASQPDEPVPDGARVNIISVMLEAYSDLSRFDGVPVNEDVYAPLHALQEECCHGTLSSSVFGGGTFNTERSFITGFSQIDDIDINTNSYVWYLRENGYRTEGIHPGTSRYYNRANVNRYLGFDDYGFLENTPGLTMWDDTFFSILQTMWDERDDSVPYFNFSVSYQNHGAYDSTKTGEEAFLAGDGLSEAAYNILNNYLGGIADTTARISAFIDGFRNCDEPVVIVFFGDHMPWLGDGDFVYAETGINIDRSTPEGFENYYSTPYIIWANDAAKKATGNDFAGEGPTISPCFLMNEVFSLCGWTGPAFMNVSRTVSETVSVINPFQGCFIENGTLTSELSSSADAYRDYMYAQYYVKHNFTY